MLALWSWAARNPGTCRCISCVSNTHAVARRVAAPSIRGLWPFGTPTSTFVYTAVFAAGLTIDAKAKVKRSEQWDSAFAHLQEEMRRPRRTRADADVEYMTIGERDFKTVEELFPEGVDWDKIYRVAGMELVDDAVFQELQTTLDYEHISESLWDLLAFDTRFPRGGSPAPQWPSNTGPDLIRHYLPPQSLWAPDHMRWHAMRKRQIWKKLAVQEVSVGVLIHDLLKHVHDLQLPGNTFASLSPHIERIALLDRKSNRSDRHKLLMNLGRLASQPADSPEETIAELRDEIRATGPIIPQYFQDQDGDFYHICQQMNGAIKNIIGGHKKDAPDSVLAVATAKLCHNLLVSSSAPNLQTFNILISGFIKWNLPAFMDDVLFALENCKIRPNEITCAAILNFYVRTNRPDDFSLFVARMRGAANALMLANPDITINEKGASRLVRIDENKVYQKVHPTPLVFGTLMMGVLKFAGFERALDIYYELKEDGWGLDVPGLSHFLDDCIERLDWHGGVYIWQEITSIRGPVWDSIMSRAYSQMLSLSSLTGNTVAFNQLLAEVVQRRFDRIAILGSAMRMTEAARRKHNKDKTWSTPAWTADNVLIAVSEYMGESRDSRRGDPPSPFDEAPPSPFDEVSPSPFDQNPEEKPAVSEEPSAKGSEEAWQAWLQHELGEPVKKGPEK